MRLDQRIAAGLKRLGDSVFEPATSSEAEPEIGEPTDGSELTALFEEAEVQVSAQAAQKAVHRP